MDNTAANDTTAAEAVTMPASCPVERRWVAGARSADSDSEWEELVVVEMIAVREEVNVVCVGIDIFRGVVVVSGCVVLEAREDAVV